MTDTIKRVRSSKTRDRRYYTAAQTLTIKWRDVFRSHTPLHNAFSEISTWIKSLDVTIAQRTTLHDRSWALRDYAVNALSRWQLYLDGVPRTFDEIAAIADAETAAIEHIGPKHTARCAVMQRICGRHEWEASHDPFYEDVEPELLSTDRSKPARKRSKKAS